LLPPFRLRQRPLLLDNYASSARLLMMLSPRMRAIPPRDCASPCCLRYASAYAAPLMILPSRHAATPPLLPLITITLFDYIAYFHSSYADCFACFT